MNPIDDYLEVWDDVLTKPCPKGHKTKYSSKWDSAFCPECNEWTEPGCKYDYPECSFDCKNRPDRPMPPITSDGKARSSQEAYNKLKNQPSVKNLMQKLADDFTPFPGG